MTRAEAIDILKNTIVRFGRSNGKTAYAEALQMAIKALQEPQWIPCSVKYPDPDERVLVTRGGYDYYVWDCMSNRGDDYFWEDEEGFYHNKYEVVAWMPPPEPWGGDAK